MLKLVNRANRGSISWSRWPSTIGSLVGVLFDDTTRFTLTLPAARGSVVKVTFPKAAQLPTEKSGSVLFTKYP
jgi:hypothetical protein